MRAPVPEKLQNFDFIAGGGWGYRRVYRIPTLTPFRAGELRNKQAEENQYFFIQGHCSTFFGCILNAGY
jgi:hypothetical protein